ncbi:MAG: DUF262 domain-containing protein [Okeania sp. SIO2F4]|uniref:DUF262 domain-containing protein n=1 Tax=Okeania sp. SIO2F4 TaxID=2607790 RepID=UPI00142D128B|nr:DUF262 domain-containing protein [Okeania sp. SIO2F4]NES04049.1 DUF262 domain-containing protein [Okeania sp. SIO2F4]
MVSQKNSNKYQAEENDDKEEFSGKDNLTYDPEKINIITREPTIEQLLRRIDEEVLNLAPDFQRHSDIWKDDVKSRLIESIIIRIPLPAFYIDATDEEQWLVVDGLQRLSALKQFMNDNNLPLTGLEYLANELDGKTYQELPRKYQRRIQETQVTVYQIAPGTPPKVKYNIFKRINTGGERLTNQEIRHALNPGQALKLLAEIAKYPEFTNVIQLGESRIKRMDDREFVLGALAVMLTFYKDYAKEGREEFLDNAMKKINNLSESEIKKLANKFKNTMIVCQEIFGDEAFRKPKKPKQRKFPVNRALFETWSFHISQLNRQEVQKLKIKKQDLIDKFAKYVDKDKEFVKSISQAQDKIEYRFETIGKIIKEVIND